MACQPTWVRGFSRLWRKLQRDEEGVAAIEFALSFPLYLTMVMVAIELSRVAFTQIIILHAAEETTRYALVNYNATNQQLETYARNNLVLIDPQNLSTILVTAPVDNTDQTKMFTVQVQYTFEPLFPIDRFLPSATAESFTLTGASRGFITQEIPTS